MSLHQFGHKNLLISSVFYDIFDFKTGELVESGVYDFIGIVSEEEAIYSLKTKSTYQVIIKKIETQKRYYRYPLTAFLHELSVFEVKNKRITEKIINIEKEN